MTNCVVWKKRYFFDIQSTPSPARHLSINHKYPFWYSWAVVKEPSNFNSDTPSIFYVVVFYTSTIFSILNSHIVFLTNVFLLRVPSSPIPLTYSLLVRLQGNIGPPGLKGDQGPEVSLCIYLMSALPLSGGQTETKNLLNLNNSEWDEDFTFQKFKVELIKLYHEELIYNNDITGI